MIYVLSGAGGKTYAFINVIYPAGSTCTCTDGKKTLNLKDTSGKGVFPIPYAATWVVRCFDGADYDSSKNKKSATVEIKSEGQSKSVTLNYAVDIFNGGAIVPFTAKNTTNAKVTIGNTILFAKNGDDAAYEKGAIAYTTNKVDLSDYNSVVFEGAFTQVINSNSDKSRVGVTAVTPYTGDSSQLYVASANLAVNNRSWTVDISAISGSHYICVSAGNGYTDYLLGSITRIYLL